MTELYLYEVIHVYRGQPRMVAAHVAALNKSSKTLFQRAYAPGIRRLTARIAALAEAERYPSDLSGFIRLELTADGQERLIPAGVSLYDGYALRSLMPDAVYVEYTLPEYDLENFSSRTSAGEATTALANRIAQTAGAAIAVQAGPTLIEADNAPLFAVRNNEVLTESRASVYRYLTLQAIEEAGLTYKWKFVLPNELDSFDELFYADHRGITALAHCNGHPYMHLIAERVAAAMERLFRKV